MITKYEFWCRLRKLERKYDEKTDSPVRRRLVRIDEWASALMEGWSPMADVPCWLWNELKHVEDGREVGRGIAVTPRELPPVYSDLMFHGVLSDRPWGRTVLPSTFVFGKTEMKNEK